MKSFVTISSKGISNKLSEIENDGADYGPDTSGTLTSGLNEAVQDYNNLQLTGGRYILKNKLYLKSGVNMIGGQNSVFVNEMDDIFDPFIIFEPYTYCNFLAVDANKRSGVQLGKPEQNNSIAVGVLKVFNGGDIFNDKYGSQTSCIIKGYNMHFMHIDINGGNTGLLLDGCSDIRGHDVLVVNSFTGINISSAEHISISNLTVDSCKFVGMQVDSSHDVSVNGTIWNNSTAYQDNVLQQAVVMGKFSSQNENQIVDLDLRIIGTGGTALEISNSRYCKLELQIINAMLNTSTQRIHTGIKFGKNVNYNTISAKMIDVAEEVSGQANDSNQVAVTSIGKRKTKY